MVILLNKELYTSGCYQVCVFILFLCKTKLIVSALAFDRSVREVVRADSSF